MAEFWQRLAKRSQSNLYFALVFLPSGRREAFRDVYRFLRAADDVVDSGISPAEARAALARWRSELAHVYAGDATHPFARRLERAVRRFKLSREHFETIFDALAEDAEPRRFATRAELERWCEAQSGTLGLLCLEILGVSGPGPRAYARDAGVALQLANILRDVADDAQRGRVYFPEDELPDASGVLARRMTPEFARAAASLAERMRFLLARGRGQLAPAERRRLLVPEIWADVYLALVGELERKGWDVFSSPPYLRRRRKLAIAARRWLREEREAVVARAARLFPHAP